MPSFIDEHSDEVVASSAKAGHCDAHAHLRQLHPHELQQQKRNTDDQDIVHTLRAYGIANLQSFTDECVRRETQLIELPVHRTIV